MLRNKGQRVVAGLLLAQIAAGVVSGLLTVFAPLEHPMADTHPFGGSIPDRERSWDGAIYAAFLVVTAGAALRLVARRARAVAIGVLALPMLTHLLAQLVKAPAMGMRSQQWLAPQGMEHARPTPGMLVWSDRVALTATILAVVAAVLMAVSLRDEARPGPASLLCLESGAVIIALAAIACNRLGHHLNDRAAVSGVADQEPVRWSVYVVAGAVCALALTAWTGRRRRMVAGLALLAPLFPIGRDLLPSETVSFIEIEVLPLQSPRFAALGTDFLETGYRFALIAVAMALVAAVLLQLTRGRPTSMEEARQPQGVAG